MRFLDLTLGTLAENLALDEALLLDAEASRERERPEEVLRVWEWPTPAVVLGAAGRLAEEVNESACIHDHVPILRRSSGGGAVLLGKGCLNYSLILSYNREPALAEVRSSYCYLLGKMRDALGVTRLACAGTSDLAIDGCKVSGNSQQRKRTHLLHHGTLLYDFDIALMGRYLLSPPRQPEYRRQRGHEEFVRSLPLSRGEIADRLRTAWGADKETTDLPEEGVQQLLFEKYDKQQWIHRR